MIRRSVFGTASMLGLAGILAFSGCSSDSDNQLSDDNNEANSVKGSIGLDLRLADGSDVDTVNYTITRNGQAVSTGTLAIGADGKATGQITGLDAGTGYSIALNAPRTRQDAGAVEGCTGSATFAVVANVTTPVSILLQCSDTSSDTGNVTINGTFNICPKVGIATAAPSTQAVGSAIALAVTATDKDNDSLTYQWYTGASVTTGVVFATGANANYTCSAPGTFSINVSVFDGDARGCRRNLTTALTVTCTGSAVVDAGTDSSTPVVDAGTDSSTPVLDSSTPVVDAGTDSSTPVVDAGTDSSTPVVDAGGPTWPLGSTACVACQNQNCRSYTEDSVNVLGECSDSACQAVVKCELDTHCFTNAQEPVLCYCGGTGAAAIDACFGSGFTAFGACKTQIETSLQTTDVGQVLERFADPQYPAGRANRLTTCIGDLCKSACGI